MDNIINKIYNTILERKETIKPKDLDPKMKKFIEDKYGPMDDKDFFSDDLDTYFKTDTNYESEGGGISHNIIKLPSFNELAIQLKKTRDLANELVRGEVVRDDAVLRGIYDQQREVFNKFRTHLRKEYPAFYAQLKQQLNEDELDEASTTGGGAGAASFTPGTGAQYATPYAFRKKGQKPNIKAYTEFGYKLVPKKIKDSGVEVKQLFNEETSVKGFQDKRIKSFDRIEQELNDIYKMLSNAKNETSDYYNDNPSSYAVVKPTDLILDYIKDIKDLLKGE